MPRLQQPDYHFLYFAPSLSAEWFFRAARLYWQTYRPIVLHDLAIVEYAPRQNSVVVTSLARSDTAPLVRAEITQKYPHVVHDPLVYDYLEDAQLTLEARSQLNQPFGVPLE